MSAPPCLLTNINHTSFMGSHITQEQIEHVARLARLRFDREELEAFTAQFNQIITYVEKLDEVDTEGIEPMSSVLDASRPLREDVAGPMLPQEKALQNAPGKIEGFFSVPKVLGDAAE